MPDDSAGVGIIIVAAGSGARFGAEKQFAFVGGRPVVDYSIEAASTIGGQIVVVVPPGHRQDDVPTGVACVPGGANRSDSVRAGLTCLPADVRFVLVHDAARPLASVELFRAILDALESSGADAVIPGIPLVDTLKEVDGGGRVVSTPTRERLVAVQTPQGFRVGALHRAHESGEVATDDAALVERSGGTVLIVPGDVRNIKITAPHDLAVVEALLGN